MNAISRPLQPKRRLRRDDDARTDDAGISPERDRKPVRFLAGCPLQPKPVDPKRHHLQGLQGSIGVRNGCEVHQHQVRAEASVADDTFVVVDEVATAVEDQLAAVNFDRLRMV